MASTPSSSSMNSSNSGSSSCGSNGVSKFGDFGKCASEFFNRDFPSDTIRIDATTKAAGPGVRFFSRGPGAASFSDEFKVSTMRDLTSGALSSELSSSTTFPLLSERLFAKSMTTLKTPNQMTQQLTLTNSVLQGLKLDVTGSFQTNGSSTAKANVEYNHGGIMVSNTAVDFVTSTTGGSLNKTDSISDIGLKNSQTPKVTSGLAVRIRDVQVGGEVGIDVEKRVVEKYALGVFLSRSREKMGLVIGTGFNTVTGTYLQKFSDQLEVACRTTWNAKLPTIGVEVGAKWWLLPPTSGYGRNSFIKTKIDSVGRLGISLSSDVRPGMQVIMGAIVETGKLGRQSNGVNVISEDASGSASHKLGIQILYTI